MELWYFCFGKIACEFQVIQVREKYERSTKLQYTNNVT